MPHSRPITVRADELQLGDVMVTPSVVNEAPDVFVVTRLQLLNDDVDVLGYDGTNREQSLCTSRHTEFTVVRMFR